MGMFEEILAGQHTVAISGHVRPDGDCTGSVLGLARYIQKGFPDLTVEVYLEEIPKKLCCLAGADRVCHELRKEAVYDVFFCLDCGDADRLGFVKPLFERAKKKVCIDHHATNGGAFADVNLIQQTKSSTCQIVYEQMEQEKIDREIAKCLFLGIVHDTGVFQYSNTSPATMRIAAHLLEYDIDAPDLIQRTYYEKTYVQQQLLGRALLKSRLLLGGRCIAVWLTAEEMEQCHATSLDTEGIVSKLRETKDVEVAIFLYELAGGEYKGSLRSKNLVDVSCICAEFGGGGHCRAAGFSIAEKPEKVIEVLCERIAKQMRESC